jgi:hypothetical protein
MSKTVTYSMGNQFARYTIKFSNETTPSRTSVTITILRDGNRVFNTDGYGLNLLNASHWHWASGIIQRNCGYGQIGFKAVRKALSAFLTERQKIDVLIEEGKGLIVHGIL